MEELQSTEVLAREILEDARKKAQRILKTGNDTVNAKTTEWEKKKSDITVELKKKYNEQCELAAIKINARLPIDKHRLKIEKIENLLNSTVELWHKSLSRKQIQKLLSAELIKRLALIRGDQTFALKRVYYCGLDKEEVEVVLKTVNRQCAIDGVPGNNCLKAIAEDFPLLVLETADLRIIASTQKTVDFLLLEKRAELIEALIGSDYMEST